MPPLAFSRARIEALVERAGERLEGEWLLIGGSAAAVWFLSTRTTEDIDLIGLAGTQAQRLALMELAAEAGLPVEAVNSAGDYFLRQIPDWRDQLVLLHAGARATIYRPSATLFLLLKIRRLSVVDHDDCLALLAHVRQTGETVDTARVIAALDALPPTSDRALAERRAALRAALAT